MKKYIITIIILLFLAVFSYAGYFYYKNLRGIGPAVKEPPYDIGDVINGGNGKVPALAENNTDFPLTLPNGFSISIFAKGLGAPRVMIFGKPGMLISIPSAGKVVSPKDTNNDGKVDEILEIATGLNRPHGLAERCGGNEKCNLYIAESDQVAVYDYDENFRAINKKKLFDLPDGGRHFTRTIMFMPYPDEDKLLVSVGSSCDTCREDDWRRASILVYDIKTEELKTFASGLRNSVFMSIHPVNGDIWATEMGRDLLGDNLPPDEINIIKEGGNYGWPICYGKNIHDNEFDKNTYIRNPCMEPFETQSYIDIPAHSAPLGLAFFPEEGWSEDYWHNLLVAYHGSWNRTKPTGYKIVRYKLDANGKYLSEEDFISGWLTRNNESLGRPVDIMIQPGGVIYISDDKTGVIYKVIYREEWAEINNFEDCIKTGYPVMESYPRQCAVPGGQKFVEDIGNELEKTDLIRISSPRPNGKISSPLTVTGIARGTWYFEATFPLKILDANNNLISQSYAQAQGEWMTENFVPFSGQIEFTKPDIETGYLILEKDNPSGLPEFDDKLVVPIKF